MAQPTQIVGCCWNHLDEPAFVAVLFLGWQEIIILKKKIRTVHCYMEYNWSSMTVGHKIG